MGDTTINHRFLHVQYVSREMVPVLYTEREVAWRRDRLYQYRISPPPLNVGIASICIPEWDQSPHADDLDHLRLQDLQDFECTDFQTSLMGTRTVVKPPRHGKRVQDGDLSGNILPKHPRLEGSSILDLIPQVCAYHPRLLSVTHGF